MTDMGGAPLIGGESLDRITSYLTALSEVDFKYSTLAIDTNDGFLGATVEHHMEQLARSVLAIMAGSTMTPSEVRDFVAELEAGNV